MTGRNAGSGKTGQRQRPQPEPEPVVIIIEEPQDWDPLPADQLAALAALAGNPHPYLRAQAAGHPDTPADVLTRLGETEQDSRVLQALATNPHASPDALTRIAFIADASARAEAALHERTPRPVLTTLLGDPHPGVAEAARIQLRHRKVLALPADLRAVAVELEHDWTGTDDALIATAAAIAQPAHTA